MPKRTKTNWATLFDEYSNIEPPQAPAKDGWKTFPEIRKELGCGVYTARAWVRSMLLCGKVEMRDLVEWEEATKRKVRKVFYRIKK